MNEQLNRIMQLACQLLKININQLIYNENYFLIKIIKTTKAQ
ncbi:hypothetical protein yberc0001_30410 [Yersinia bercovieri ATCC 43970]|uniref:Uncharacterized protein n=1 Tax=Yersinia bercovieri ATCC 43970 TaxID=349968 RepID=A0ABP2E7A8_YERBE|nr:hypothetical protein yberc0001_30410 [Yersinia bercovieri ATCC 43970]